MYEKEIKKIKKALSRIDQRSNVEKKISKIVGCVEMINSLLIYSYDPYDQQNTHYLKDYREDLGDELVDRLIEEQKEHFDKNCIIHRNTYTDDEGLSYNSVEETNNDTNKYHVYNIGFYNDITKMDDETQFDVESMSELNELFRDFCKENRIDPNVQIHYIEEVDVA